MSGVMTLVSTLWLVECNDWFKKYLEDSLSTTLDAFLRVFPEDVSCGRERESSLSMGSITQWAESVD